MFSLRGCVEQALAREKLFNIKICGSLIQGSKVADGLHLFLHTYAVKKDGNAVATELFDLIRCAREQRHRHLILSFDNAAGEAKNDTILALCDLLVAFDWFDTVEIHQLEPGHTHTYLDALYSHLQRALREHTLVSVADVVDALTHLQGRAAAAYHYRARGCFGLVCVFRLVAGDDRRPQPTPGLPLRAR